MNAQLRFASSREFWAGVGSMIIVGILIAVGVPNLMRSRLSLYVAIKATGLSEGYIARDKLMGVSLISEGAEERKIIGTASMDMLVKSPKETSEKIRLLAEQVGGFLVTSEISGGEDDANASLTVRVP
jgi:hypothetical protein